MSSQRAESVISMKVQIKGDAPEKVLKVTNVSDGGWGWMVMICAILIRTIISGIVVSSGLFLKEFVNEYKVSQTTVSWMASLISGLLYIVSPLACLLAARFGNRPMSILGLFLAGICFASPFFYSPLWFLYVSSITTALTMGFAFTCSNIILTTYFDKYLSVVMGFFSAATGAASFIMVPLITFLINTHGWRMAMLVYGGILWLGAILALAYSPARSVEIETEENTKGDIELMAVVVENKVIMDLGMTPSSDNIVEEKDLDSSQMLESSSNVIKLKTPTIGMKNVDTVQPTLEDPHGVNMTPGIDQGYLYLLKDPVVLLFLFSNFLTNAGNDTMYMYAKEKALEAGISQDMATVLLTTIGIGSFVGRLVFGFTGSIRRISMYQQFVWCLIIGGASVILSKFAYNYALMIAYTIVFGLFIGGAQPLMTMVLTLITPISVFPQAFALSLVAQAAGLILCTPLSGFIYDRTKILDWSFVVSGSLMLGSGLVLLLAYLSRSFRNSKYQQ